MPEIVLKAMNKQDQARNAEKKSSLLEVGDEETRRRGKKKGCYVVKWTAGKCHCKSEQSYSDHLYPIMKDFYPDRSGLFQDDSEMN